ncbi:MAG: ABC transporter permease [Candidatus Omnitrophica bacterium]|nr:ABC transporter permease [Candidatus Omnitrophota bacterium]
MRGLLYYFFRRVGGLVPVFLGVTLVSFVVIHLAPGEPGDAGAAFNPKVSAQAGEKLKELYGLDRPILAQYGSWLGRFFRLDFGNSFVDGEKVTAKIARAVPVTLVLNGLSLFLILLAGIPLGILGAVKAGSRLDRTLTFFVLAGFSLPAFWLALLLMSFLGVGLRILPVSGLTSLFWEEMNFLAKAMDLARHLLLPVLVSSVTGLAGIARFVRSGMLGVLRENYIRTARAKGLSEKAVIYRHALRNALLPVITILGLSVPGLLGGSVIFESVFSIPGMGRLFFQSVFARDYPVIMGVLVLGAFLTLLGNLLADAAYRLADPRVR